MSSTHKNYDSQMNDFLTGLFGIALMEGLNKMAIGKVNPIEVLRGECDCGHH